MAALGVLGCDSAERPDALHVFAASSLTEAFQELATAFEQQNPSTRVALAFAGSHVLRLQIEQGAPADVFASAHADHVRSLIDAGRADSAQPFARNRLVLVVPKDNPAGIEALIDLPRAERIVLGTPNVPVGWYGRALITEAARRYGPTFERSVLERVVSEESNVRLVRAKVELGEADAAFLYHTDVGESDRLLTIPIDPELSVRATYEAASLKAPSGSSTAGARAWIALLRSPGGRAILERHGFEVG